MTTETGSGDGYQPDPLIDAAAGPIRPSMSRAVPQRFVLSILGTAAIAAWLPMLAVLATIGTVVVTGCQVDEAAVHSCMVAGHDIGEALGTGLLLVFVAAPAVPVALGASVLWVILWRRYRRASTW